MQPVKATRFTGIDNRSPVHSLPAGEEGRAVRDAVNVDLNKARKWQRRPGFAQSIECTNGRCMFEAPTGAYFADENELRFFDGNIATTITTLASALAHVCYAETPLGVVYSDGFAVNLIRNGAVQPVAPAKPNPLPVASAVAGGGLRQGVYGVAFASERTDGQRSAMSAPQFVTVSEGGTVRVTGSGHTLAVAVFMTAADGRIFYRAGTLAVGATTLDLVASAADGEAVDYEPMESIPPGNILALHKGRLISVRGPSVYISMPWAFGLYRSISDYFVMPENITLLESVEGGLYLATLSKTYWLGGPDIGQASLTEIAPFGAVKGTTTRIPNATGLMWHTPRGPVRADINGGLSLLQDEKVVYDAAASGASVFRETNGLRQFIAALTGAVPTGGAVFGSYMEAEVVN
jgi:hypothetical protein